MTSSSSLLTTLNHSRDSLAERVADLLPGWGTQEPCLARLGNYQELTSALSEQPDVHFAALIRLGQEGVQDACWVVVYAMLGRAVRLARGDSETLADLVGELWVSVAEYPLERRPRSIAANLSWALHHRAHQQALSSSVTVPELPSPTPEPDASRTLALARDLGVIDARAHRTLWLVYVAGLRSHQVAELLGVSPEVVRWRCSQEIRRMRQHSEWLAA